VHKSILDEERKKKRFEGSGKLPRRGGKIQREGNLTGFDSMSRASEVGVRASLRKEPAHELNVENGKRWKRSYWAGEWRNEDKKNTREKKRG